MTSSRWSAVPLLVALLVGTAALAAPSPAAAQMPTVRAKRGSSTIVPDDWRRIQLSRRVSSASAARTPMTRARVVVTESEPNNSSLQADSVTLGDTASGDIDPAGDVDFYTLNLTAGTLLSLDVIAERAGSPLDAILALFDVDGTTQLAFNDDANGLDSHIEFTIPATGRYYVRIAGFGASGGPGSFYSLSFGVSQPGPGDPTTLYSAAVGGSWGIAAGSTGELYVADINGRIMRISSTGVVTTFDTLFSPVGVVIDGFGNLLVAGQNSALQMSVTRISPAGQRSVFAPAFGSTPDCCIVIPITVGPNGDVWVGNNASTPAQIRHYDPSGNFIGAISISGVVLDLAFSPSGELFFTAGDAVNKIVNNAEQLVFNAPPILDGLAFDRDGYLYLGSSAQHQVHLYDPAGVAVDTPFARTNLNGRIHLAFLRDANGAMTSRLLAANVAFDGANFVGSIVEMNPTGMRAPGLRIGGDLLQIANTSLRAGVIGADYADTLRIVSPPGAVTWSVVSGAPPPGITLAPTTGILSGIPTDNGVFTFTVRGDAGSRFGIRTFTLTVTPPTVVVAAAATHLLGGVALDAVSQRFFDFQGNNNGRFDIGDFRAYLRAIGQLPALRVLARKEQP